MMKILSEATNRFGDKFVEGEEIMMADYPMLYKKMISEVLIIKEIIEFDSCESGYMIQVIHKNSATLFNKKLDINWFKKITT